MSLNWPLINSISLSIFIILILTRMIVWKYQSNNISLPYDTNHQFSEDKLLTKTEVDNEDQSPLTSYIYQAENDDNQIINQYMLVIEGQNKSMVIDYKEEKEHADTLVYIYNKNKKLINVLFLSDPKDKRYSNVIDLPQKTQYINIQSRNPKESNPNDKEIKRPSKKIILLDSLALLFGLFSITYYIAYIVGGNKIPSYLLNNGIYVSLSLILLISIINFLLMNQFSKNQKEVGE